MFPVRKSQSHEFQPDVIYLRQLLEDLSGAPEIQHEAFRELGLNVFQHGSIFFDIDHVLQVLWRYLDDPEFSGKDQVVVLLQHIATAESELSRLEFPLMNQSANQSANQRVNQRANQNLTALQVRLAEVHGRVRRSRLLVESEVSRYQQLFRLSRSLETCDQLGGSAESATADSLESDEHRRLRVVIPFLLAVCQERRNSIEAWMLAELDLEQDHVVRASMIEALCRLWWLRSEANGEDLRSQGEYLSSYLIGGLYDVDENALVRTIIALNLLTFGDSELQRQSLRLCEELYEQVEETLLALPWGQGERLVHIVATALESNPELAVTWYERCITKPNLIADAMWGLANIAQEWRVCGGRIAAAIGAVIEAAAEEAHPETGLSLQERRSLADRAANDIRRIGLSAIPVLQKLEAHPDSFVSRLARESLCVIRRLQLQCQTNDWDCEFGDQLEFEELLVVASGRSADFPSQFDQCRAIKSLGRLKPKNLKVRMILQQQLQNRDAPWIRVHAARALWRTTHAASLVLPTLIEELKGRPAGFFVLEVLIEMASAARPALRSLQALIHSKRRLIEFGEFYQSAHQDDLFRERCQRAVQLAQARGT